MALINEINRFFAQSLELDTLPINHSSLREKYTTVSPRNLEDFLAHLVSAGTEHQLIYLENSIDKNSFDELIKTANHPFLIFIRENDTLKPVVVHREKGDLIANMATGTSLIPLVLPEFSTLWDRCFKRENSKGEEEAVVITCFPNTKQEISDDLIDPKTGRPSRFRTFVKLIELLTPERREILHILLYAIFVGIISLSLPLGVQSLIGFISSGQVVTSATVLIIFILLGIIFSGIMLIYQLELVEYLQQRLFARTAFAYAFRIPRLKLEAMLKYNPPELMNRFFDTLTLQKGVPVILLDLSAALLQVLLGTFLLSLYHPLFIIIGAVLISILIILLRMTGKRGLSTAFVESEHKYKVVNWLEELARSITTFKLAGNTGFAMERTDYHVSNYIKAREDHFKVLKVQYYSFVIFKTIITAMLLILGVLLIVNKQINLGQFVAAEIVIILIMNSIEKIIMKIDDVYDVLVSVEKVSKVTELPTDAEKSAELEVVPGEGLSVIVTDLSYQFPEGKRKTLNNISFTIAPRDRICISGPNGSGKSTLSNLLLGIFEPTGGTIKYNGTPLRELNRPLLMNHIGNYISQDTIFDGTVFENITIGRRNIEFKDVIWATTAAGVLDYINSLKDGFETRLIGGGIRVPESVMHKLIIARNLVERPSLLIVDDFLLGVERSEKKRILEFLTSPSFPCTVILISNEPMVMEMSNRMILLDEGKIVAEGKFNELKQSNDILKDLIQQKS
jgi:ABC-type bacteriocin/lantibiotic exporter with double-glycine peptidase domain